MGIQLKVNGPQGDYVKVLDLCDSKEQLEKITVEQLKEKIARQLVIGTFLFCFLNHVGYKLFFLIHSLYKAKLLLLQIEIQNQMSLKKKNNVRNSA